MARKKTIQLKDGITPYAVPHRKKRGHGKLIAALLLILLLVGGYFLAQEYLVLTPDGFRLELPNAEEAKESAPKRAAAEPASFVTPRISIENGGELPGYGAGELRAEWLDPMELTAEELRTALLKIAAHGCTGVVIPVKPEAGERMSAETIELIAGECSRAHLRFVAYISCFRDDLAARADQNLAIIDKWAQPFIDAHFCAWLNPYESGACDIVTENCLFAAEHGADELLLDNLCFPTSGDLDMIYYGAVHESRRNRLCAYAEELSAQFEIPVGAVLYGDDTLGEGVSAEFGQDLSRFAAAFDRVWAHCDTAENALFTQHHATMLDPLAGAQFAAILGTEYRSAAFLLK